MILTFAVGAILSAVTLAAGVPLLCYADDHTSDEPATVDHTVHLAPAAAEPAPVERRRLTPAWADLLQMPDVPELHAPDREPAELVRPYIARHRQDETVDLAKVRGAARIRAQYRDTEVMPAVTA